MPTTRPRHPITETDEIAAAIEVANRRWPEEHGNPTRLLKRLILEGRAHIENDAELRRQKRIAAIRDGAGSLSGIFGPNALAELREDWPE